MLSIVCVEFLVFLHKYKADLPASKGHKQTRELTSSLGKQLVWWTTMESRVMDRSPTITGQSWETSKAPQKMEQEILSGFCFLPLTQTQSTLWGLVYIANGLGPHGPVWLGATEVQAALIGFPQLSWEQLFMVHDLVG